MAVDSARVLALIRFLSLHGRVSRPSFRDHSKTGLDLSINLRRPACPASSAKSKDAADSVLFARSVIVLFGKERTTSARQQRFDLRKRPLQNKTTAGVFLTARM